MTREPLKPEDIQLLSFVERVKASPDEQKLLISVKQIKEYRYINNLHLYNTADNHMVTLTKSDFYNDFLAWSTDSRSIWFTSDRDGDKELALYSIRIDGGEPEKIMEIKDLKILEWQWLDDKRAVLLCQDNEIQGLKHDKDIIYYEFDKPVYKYDGRGYIPRKFPDFYIFNTEDKSMELIRTAPKPKSNLIIDREKGDCYFISNLSKDIYYRSNYNDIICFNSGKRKLKTLKTVSGPKTSFDISPDKSTMAVVSHFYPDEFSGARKFDLIIYSLGSSGHRNASARIADSVQNNIISDMEQAGWFKKPVYSADGSHVFFNVSEKASNRIYRYSFRDGKSEAITGTDSSVIDYDTADRFVFAIMSSAARPAELYKIDPEDGSKKMITGFNRDFTEKKLISEPRQYSIKNKSGHEVDYWIMKPPEFHKDKKHPLILNIHGGPHAQFANTFFFEFQVMASAGYIILYSNPTGSMGKGYDFAKKLENNWGRPDSDDIRLIMEEVIKLDFVDTARLGVTGGSYGGFMTNWLLGTTDYFKTGITERCVSNLAGMAENSDFSYYTPRQFRGYFWREPERYWDMSPIRFVDKIKAPLLIVHSDNDQRTPLSQAEGLYTALKILRRKARLVIFPRESHGLNRQGDPRKREERLKLFTRWFDKYLK